MPTADQLNSALGDRYAVDRLVGEGGMATVYLARDLRHSRRVALKVLKPDLGAVVGVERFLSEIQVTANLQHPNLLPLFDSGQAGDAGLLFYVMPFVEGESLRARLDREKQLPIDEAIRIAAAVAGALDYAHRHGVIHRDLKPENILLHDGQPLIADFGIALAVSNAGGNRITQTGLSLGTPQYMSPEQATGDRVIDGRTDIYSLGALTYEMLTGEAPHIGSTSQAIIARVLTEKPRPVRASRPSVPEHVEAAVECALEKLPADRWATAKEFSEALTGARSLVVRRSTVSRTPVADTAPAPERRRVSREVVAWSVAVLGVAAAGLLAARGAPPATLLPPHAEFEVLLPDSIEPRPFGGAAAIALSRDGSTLVFQGQRSDGTPMLFLRRLGDRDVQPIRGTDSARGPVLSPAGDEVLFAITRPGQGAGAYVRRVSILGGRPRTVLDSAVANGQLAWSDDGRIVSQYRRNLWISSADGGAPTRLARPDTSRDHFSYGFPDVLPGSRAVLVTVQKRSRSLAFEASTIGAVTIPEGRVTDLGIRGTYPRYSATGHLLFVSPDAMLMAVPFDAGALRVTGTPVPVAENVRMGGGGAAGFGVSGNGTLVYLTGGVAGGNERLLVVDRAGVERELAVPHGFYQQPKVSPDGRQIAVGAGIAGFGGALRDPDIWWFDTTARTFNRLTTDSNSVRPVWSHDGQRLAYVWARAGQSDSSVRIRSLYASARESILVRAPDVITDVSLGPAGSYVAMRLSRGTPDIWIAPIDSPAAPRSLLAEPYTEMTPRISPDGLHLAYVSDRTGRLEVYVRPLRGGGSDLQISVNGGSEPVWGRDGRELFYRGSDSIFSARTTTTPRLVVERREALFRDTYERSANWTNYDVFPGSRQFVMLRRGGQERERFPLIVNMNWHARLQAPRP